MNEISFEQTESNKLIELNQNESNKILELNKNVKIIDKIIV
jgi:hypothetical protein